MRFKQYIEIRKPSKQTIINYERTIKIYETVQQMKLDQLLEEAEQEQLPYINERNQIITPNPQYTNLYKRLNNFIQYLENRNLSNTSINQHINIIKILYKNCSKTTFPQLPQLKETTRTRTPLTQNSIKQLLKHCNKKYQAVTLLLATTGMRIYDADELKISDWLKSINEPDLETCLSKEINKEGYYEFHPHKTPTIKCQTFTTPECNEAIRQYLIDEKRKHELKENNYLFNTLSNKPRFDKSRTYNLYYSKRKQTIKNTTYNYTPHMFRKYFITIASNYCNNLKIVARLAGHTLPEKTDKNYVFFSREQMWEHYKDLIPYLSFNEEVKIRSIDSKDLTLMRNLLKRYERKEQELLEQLSFDVSDL